MNKYIIEILDTQIGKLMTKKHRIEESSGNGHKSLGVIKRRIKLLQEHKLLVNSLIIEE